MTQNFLMAAILVIGYCAACAALAWHRSTRAGRPRRDRLRELGWAGGLFAVGASALGLFGTGPWPAVVLLAAAGVLVMNAPATPRAVLPWLLLVLGVQAFVIAAKSSNYRGDQMLYGTVLGGAGSWRAHLAMPLAYAFAAAGLWLLWRAPAWRARLGRFRPGWALLLLPLIAMTGELVGFRWWPGIGWVGRPLTALIVVLGAGLADLATAWAADLAVAGLFILGAYGAGLGSVWPAPIPGPGYTPPPVMYGVVMVDSRATAILAAAQGIGLLALGAWLAPRTIGQHGRALLGGQPYAALASRVEQLTQTRTVAVDSAAGVEKRLATFDGVLAVSSPPGGPTMIVMEVPCALSSPRTSSC